MANFLSFCAVCETAAAKYFCQDDDQYFCEDHFQFHQKLNHAKGHNTVCLLGHCIHDRKIFYCKDHDILCCKNCRKAHHTDCEIVRVDELVGKSRNIDQECTEMVTKMKTLKITMEEKLHKAQDNESKWVSEINKALDEVNNLMKELETKIKKRMDYIKCITKQKCEELKGKVSNLHDAITDIEKKSAMLNEAQNENARLLVCRNLCCLEETLEGKEHLLRSTDTSCYIEFLKAEHNFEARNYVERTLTEFNEAVESLNQIYSDVRKCLIPFKESDDRVSDPTESGRQEQGCSESSTIDFARCLDPNNTCRCEDTEPKMVVKSRHRSRHSSGAVCDDETLRKFSERYAEAQSLVVKREGDTYPSIPVQAKCTMNVNVEDDQSKCCITGISPVAKGTLYIMADYQNKNLKLFQSCGKLENQMRFEVNPRDIAKIDEETVLVNFPIAKNMQVVHIEADHNILDSRKKMKIGELKISTNAKCCGIDFHDNKIYAATQIPSQVLIMSRQGDILHSIPGKDLFERPTYISVDKETSLIYLADPNKKYLLCIDNCGKVQFSHKVQLPHGVVCIGNGCALVADWETGIQLVDSEGNRCQELKLEKSCPQKLAFDPEKQMLLVTEWQSNIVRTFYLKKN